MVVTHKNSIKNTTQSKRGSKTSKQKLVVVTILRGDSKITGLASELITRVVGQLE